MLIIFLYDCDCGVAGAGAFWPIGVPQLGQAFQSFGITILHDLHFMKSPPCPQGCWVYYIIMSALTLTLEPGRRTAFHQQCDQPRRQRQQEQDKNRRRQAPAITDAADQGHGQTADSTGKTHRQPRRQGLIVRNRLLRRHHGNGKTRKQSRSRQSQKDHAQSALRIEKSKEQRRR